MQTEPSHAVGSIGLLAFLRLVWQGVTVRKRYWNVSDGSERCMGITCVRLLGPLGLLTPGDIIVDSYTWRIGRVVWLSPQSYLHYKRCFSPSVLSWIFENKVRGPIKTMLSASCLDKASISGVAQMPVFGAGQDSNGCLSGSLLQINEAKASSPSSMTCTSNPSHCCSSSSVINKVGSMLSANVEVTGDPLEAVCGAGMFVS